MAGSSLAAFHDGVLRVLVKVIHIHLALAGLALQVSPGIRSPCKGAITENVGLGEVGFFLCLGRIETENLVCPASIYLMDSFLIVTYTDRAAKHTSFVAVGSYDDIYIIVVSLFIELILVIGDGVAVNVRPEGLKGGILHDVHSRNFS